MQKWYATLALACGCSVAVAGSVSAQVQIQVQVQGQAQAVQAQPAQALPIQVQVLPVQKVAPPIMLPGRMIARPGFNLGSRLTPVDAVFVGRVVAFEPMDVEATQTPKGAKANYRVAVVQVSESILGLKKGTKQVRVAFVVQGNNNGAPGVGVGGPAAGGGVQILPVPVQPGIRPGFRPPIRWGNAQIQLQMGQEGLFSVNKHHKETFFLSPDYQHFVNRQNNAGFDNEVKTAKQLSKVMADPVKALKSDDKQDRYTAAAMLVAKYRMPGNFTGRAMKTEQVDAAESKLILKAISGGNWAPNNFNSAIPAPYTLFSQLGISQKDGYNPVNLRTAADIYQAMQKWLNDNNGKYRINRYVVDPNAPATGPGIRPLPPINRRGGVIQIQPLPAPIPQAAPAQRNNQ